MTTHRRQVEETIDIVKEVSDIIFFQLHFVGFACLGLVVIILIYTGNESAGKS